MYGPGPTPTHNFAFMSRLPSSWPSLLLVLATLIFGGAGVGALTPAAAGLLDVTEVPGVDPSGTRDCSEALQRAIVTAQDQGKALFFPAGTYLISQPLVGLQTVPGRDCAGHDGRRSVQWIGSTKAPSIIRLVDGAEAFQDASAPRPMLEILFRDSQGQERPNCSYRNAIRGLTLDLGRGNPGAVGIRFDNAQHCFLEDVVIEARDGFAGVDAIPGSGGGAFNVTVRGGKHAFYLKDTSLGAVIVGARCYEQREEALVLSVLRGIAVVGLEVTRSRGEAPAIRLDAEINAFEGHLSLTDARLELPGQAPAIDNRPGRFLALTNVYLRGSPLAVLAPAGTPELSLIAEAWTRVHRYSFTPEFLPGRPSAPATNFVEGERDRTTAWQSDTEAPPEDLLSRHLWATTPSFEDPDAVAVTDFGALPNDEVDDTEALEKALASHDKVFLPAGEYRVSRPLTLRADAVLMGVPGYWSELRPTSEWEPEGRSWVIETVNDPQARTVLMDVVTDTDDNTPIGGLRWRAGRHSMVRDFRNYLAGGRSESQPTQLIVIEGHGGGRWYTTSDHVNESGDQPVHPEFRRLVIQGTREPLSFYGFNLERGGPAKDGDPQWPFLDVRQAANVRIFGHKSESEGLVARFEDCRNIFLSIFM